MLNSVRMRRTLGAIGWLVIAAVACQRGSPDSVRVLTLEDIPGGYRGPEVLDLSSTTATIQFDSGIPTVCNAAYGETRQYGQVATIPMLEGATLDHVLTFTDLQPGTTYHYRITLTDIRGAVYQSQDFSFTTLVAEAPAAETNWLGLQAGARVLEVSSNFGGAANDEAWGANSALDGNAGTAWSSASDGDEAYLVVALPGEIQIDRLRVHTRTMANDTAQIFSFAVIDEQGATHGPFELPDAARAYEFAVDIRTRTLRFEALETNGGNTGFVELAAFGTLIAAP